MEAKRGTNLVERKLAAVGRHTMLLDGDNLRQGLNADLGFHVPLENVRRVGETARLMADAGLIVMVALMSPFGRIAHARRRSCPMADSSKRLSIRLWKSAGGETSRTLP